jgi:NAD(P)-dependent dehydrogenase (short-subunit alcohol dehydrogenase family)
MAVNARGPFLCYKYAAQQLIKQGRGGRIIGASSSAGKLGAPLVAAYCASKFAVRGLTQTAGENHILSSCSSVRFLIKPALELGRYNITVNSYAPGVIETPLSKCRQCIRS